MKIVIRTFIRYLRCSLCSGTVPIILLVLSVTTAPGNPGTFAPVEENETVSGVSEREGLERAETRFSPEALTQVLIKSGTDDVRTEVQKALNTVNGRFEQDGSEFVVESVRPDRRGNMQVHVVQLYKGVKVIGAEMNIILQQDGAVPAVSGFFAPALKLEIEPNLRSDDIAGVIRKDFGEHHEVIEGPVLVIYGSKLAYSVVVAKKGERPSKWRYYIDANTGSILVKYSDIKY